ncbi:uncharacterized protein LOC143614003 [Bidens hawaiensis]|uniref:uncharacterized protein LOC143614003 n=1 Tax=Bidens hawaiensis TaxID=980011 RepID=UPI00404A694B
MRLENDLSEHFEYFQQRDDARGKPGFMATQNITTALRQLAYGVGSDMLDEYLQMTKKTGHGALNHFCRGVISLYKRRDLRRPTMYDIQRIYEVHGEKHGFPGMLGILDCMHVGWAMVVGSNNNLNVIDQSPIIDDLIDGVGPPQVFLQMENISSTAYASPVSDKQKYFTNKQESARKDIERAFGVLKKRWAMLANPIRFWTREKITEVVITCIILHNMIQEDEGHAICQNYKGDIPRQVSTIMNNDLTT